MKNSLGKLEKLKNRQWISQLHETGKVIKTFPLRMLYLPKNHAGSFPILFSTTVSKKRFKKAVMRNKIKRQVRESYRLQKGTLHRVEKRYVVMFSYIAKELYPSEEIEKRMQKILHVFKKRISIDEK